jgi:hypothetical protein
MRMSVAGSMNDDADRARAEEVVGTLLMNYSFFVGSALADGTSSQSVTNRKAASRRQKIPFAKANPT